MLFNWIGLFFHALFFHALFFHGLFFHALFFHALFFHGLFFHALFFHGLFFHALFFHTLKNKWKNNKIFTKFFANFCKFVQNAQIRRDFNLFLAWNFVLFFPTWDLTSISNVQNRGRKYFYLDNSSKFNRAWETFFPDWTKLKINLSVWPRVWIVFMHFNESFLCFSMNHFHAFQSFQWTNFMLFHEFEKS